MMRDIYQKYGILSIEHSDSYLSAGYYQPEHTILVKLRSSDFQRLIEFAEKWDKEKHRHYSDMYIRENNQAVNKAYEKYQMFLELARSEST